MTTRTSQPELASLKWSLDDLLGTLDKTVTVEHVKRRTKQRVVARASTVGYAGSGLLVAVISLAATAAAAGVSSLVSSEFEERAAGESPPQVVRGVGTPKAGANARKHPAEWSRADAKAPVPRSESTQTSSSRATIGSTRTALVKPSALEAPSVPVTKARASKANARSSEDPTRVAQALRALRKEGRPERAQALLDSYLTEHPAGSLAEEALALSIEASLHDSPRRAGAYARRYLAEYPRGRYRKLAESAIARAALGSTRRGPTSGL